MNSGSSILARVTVLMPELHNPKTGPFGNHRVRNLKYALQQGKPLITYVDLIFQSVGNGIVLHNYLSVLEDLTHCIACIITLNFTFKPINLTSVMGSNHTTWINNSSLRCIFIKF